MTTIILYIAIIALTALYSYQLGYVNAQKKYYESKPRVYNKVSDNVKHTTIEKR